MLNSKVNIGSKYDVIVIGGGPSGSGAAIEAGRAGARVLLAERQYCLGGMWTSGFVNPLFDFENKTGLIKELVTDLSEKGNWGGFWDKSFNFEYMKSLLEQKCIDAGVDILYDTSYIGLEKDGKSVKGVYLSNIDGITYYEADVFIDATGDACTVEDMGLPYSIGEDNNPKSCQAMTLMFVVSGVPEKYKDGLVIYDLVQNAFDREGKGKKLNFDMPYLIPVPNSRFATIQLTHMHGFSPLDASDRVTANCCAMGEAAGKAAAYATKHAVSVREVPTEIYFSK